jgi:hypothetical protein
MSALTLLSSHSHRADSGGRMSFMPLTAVSFSSFDTRVPFSMLTAIFFFWKWENEKQGLPTTGSSTLR